MRLWRLAGDVLPSYSVCPPALLGGHIAGKINDAADWLSRLSAPGAGSESRPVELRGVSPKRLGIRDSEFYFLSPPGLNSEIWGASTSVEPSEAWRAAVGKNL